MDGQVSRRHNSNLNRISLVRHYVLVLVKKEHLYLYMYCSGFVCLFCASVYTFLIQFIVLYNIETGNNSQNRDTKARSEGVRRLFGIDFGR